MAVREGSSAPDFTLYSAEQEAFQLSEQRGRRNVLLLFIPGAFTSISTSELNAVNDELDEFGDDTVVVGISTDSPSVLGEFREMHGIRFPLLSDHDAEVSERYGALFGSGYTPASMDRVSKRAAFVVDKEGMVRYAEVKEEEDTLPDFGAVREALSSLD